MPWTDDEMQSLMGNAPAPQSAPLSGLPDLTWGQTLEKKAKQVANIVPQTASDLFQDAVGVYGAIRPDQVTPSDIEAAGHVAPKFDVGPSTGLGDTVLNDVVPQIASWVLPYGEISKGAKALGAGGILAEGLAQGGANALSAAGEGTQGNPLNSGILGTSSGIVQAALPRWQRALPLAAISALDYAHTGNAYEAGGNFIGNLLPGAFKASDITAAKLAPNDLDAISSGLGLKPQSIESPIQAPITPTAVEPSGLGLSNDQGPLAPTRYNGIPFDTGDSSSFRTTPYNLAPAEIPQDTPLSGLKLADSPTPLEATSSLTLDRSGSPLLSPVDAPEAPSLSGLKLEGQTPQQSEFPIIKLQGDTLDPNINFKLVDDPNAIRQFEPENTGDLLSWKPPVETPQPLLEWHPPVDPEVQAPSLAPDSSFADKVKQAAHDTPSEGELKHPGTDPYKTLGQRKVLIDSVWQQYVKNTGEDISLVDFKNRLSQNRGQVETARADYFPKAMIDNSETGFGNDTYHTIVDPISSPSVEAPKPTLPEVMTPSGDFMNIKPRQNGPHIISSVLDEGDGQYLAGDKWNDPHQEGDNSIFMQNVDTASGLGKSAFLLRDEQGNIRVAGRYEAGRIADISGQRTPETVGEALQSQDLVDTKPTAVDPVKPQEAINNEKISTQQENQSIEAQLRSNVQAAKANNDGVGIRIAARKLQDFLEANKPSEAEAAANKAAGLAQSDVELGSTGKKVQSRSLTQGMSDVGMIRGKGNEMGGITPETAAVLALGGVAAAITYQKTKGDIGSTLAAAMVGMGLGFFGARAIMALRDSVGPEAKLVSTKVPDATLTERIKQFAKDTSQTKGGMAVYGRGGITANTVRMAEGLAGLNGTPFFRDSKILADGFVADQLNTLSAAMNEAKPYKPSPGFQEASAKFLEGRLADQAAVDAVIRNGGGLSSADFQKLPTQQQQAYPEKWFVTNDLRNTQGAGVETYRVTNQTKSTLRQMQETALNNLIASPDDREFAKMIIQARSTTDNLMQVVHDALPPGLQRNKVLGTMGQYMSRTHALLTDPNYYPTENEIQNAMNRLASIKEERFISQNATKPNAVGSVPVNYKGQQYFFSPVDAQAWQNVHTPESLRSLVSQYIQDIKQVAAGKTQGLVTADTSQIGSSLFSGRKDLDEVTQALLGTHEAPVEVIQNTINKLVPSARASHFMSSLITMADDRTGLSHAYSSEIEYNKAVNDIKDELRQPGISPRAAQANQTKLQELSSYIPISGSDPKFGIFQGSYVSRMAADQLKGYNGPFGILDNAIGKGLANFNQLVKDTHLVLNPITQIRNIMQIPMFLAMGKAAANPSEWMSAIEAMKNPLSEVGKRLTQNGVFAGNPVHGEFNEGMMNLQSLLSGDTDRSIWSKVKKGKAMIGELYSMPDNFVRASVYLAEESRAAKKFGVSVDAMDPRVMEQARMFMSRRTLDYANVPTWVKAGRQIPFVSMYLSYTHEILRVAKNMSVDALHGDLHAGATLAGIASLPFLLQNMAENKLSPTDLKAWQQANAVSAPYSRYRFKLPTSRNANGTFNYLDITPLSHFSDFQMMGRAMAHKDFPSVGAVNPFFGTDNTPLLSLLSEQITGQDVHTGRAYRGVSDRALAIAREIVPPHTPGIGYEYMKDVPESFGGDLGVTNLKNGRTNTIEGAISRHLTGVDYTQVNPGLSERSYVASAKQEIANERQYLMDTLKTEGLSADAKKRATDRFVESVHRITSDMQTRLQLVSK